MMRLKGGAACLFALALSVAACAEEPVEDAGLADEPLAEPAEEMDVSTPVDGDEVTVADIAGDPAEYAGRTVTVSADVEEVLGPMAFTLDEDAITEGGIDDDVLVITNQASNLEAIDDQWLDNTVRVTGTVGTWTIVEIEQEVGWDLDPELEAEVEEREAVLVATSIERTDQ